MLSLDWLTKCDPSQLENAVLMEPGMSMITKPFAMEALATRVREILEK
jgi:DNA-binding response OmpR family regulator